MEFSRPNVIYTFGDYRLDTSLFQIERSGETLSVEPQVLELLIYLIENRGQVVTKDDLMENIWKGRVVSDATLSSRISSARHIIGDDGNRQHYIKTIHGRGFRFTGEVKEIPPARQDADGPPDEAEPISRPPTRYAKSGDIHIAYHLYGRGPPNMILMPGFVSHMDNYWELPAKHRFMCHLGASARIAMFDKRGTGMSDKVDALPRMDERMDDVRAVMDAAGFQTAYIMGISEGGSLAALFAAHHPERCDGLILYGSFAQFKHWIPDDESLQHLFDYIENDWGSGKSLSQFAPSVADEPEVQEWWGKFERLGATPGAAISLMKMNSQIDISHVLPSIRVPTLVVHRTDDVLIDIDAGRQLANEIPGAELVELPGKDHLLYIGDNRDEITDAILRFLQRPTRQAESKRFLATIIYIKQEPASGPRSADPPESRIMEQLKQYRASRVVPESDGTVAIFDGPGRGLECAHAVSSFLQARNVDHRIGVHAGEVELHGDAPGGVAIAIAKDVVAHADNGEVVVSRTVSDLVAGSAVELRDRGAAYLPSIEQDWHLYRLDSGQDTGQ